ncbi:MAG: adenylyltransferase/cytidyltransferase family protein [Clostridia bacterium]|nr:adenylyltransferase/cytidyltransferase family protein [Clostridia bacterium]
MTKVITYGTYDLLHYGHIRLLERAKALGDYLVVGVTSDDFDKSRGKINNQQSLIERIAAIKETGIADEIIVEEYEGQKIDDIKRYGIDIFTVGSDWKGKFDYLSEYCKVIYLDRTEGVSSSGIRAEQRMLKVSSDNIRNVEKKFIREAGFVNGVEFSKDEYDAKYIVSMPENHYSEVKKELENGKSVICESPITCNASQTKELFQLAKQNKCFLFDGLKTAYATAFSRMLLLVKSGKIGNVVSIDATCTSMADFNESDDIENKWNSICSWGPVAMLPIFQIFGVNYTDKRIATKYLDKEKKFDAFTKIDFTYPNAVASIKVAKKAKSEGELIITGTKGYIVVPAPWWKTDYFEVRYENPQDNKRYFYQLDGEGIRYEIAAFAKSVSSMKNYANVPVEVSIAISKVIEDFYNGNVVEIKS